MMDKCKSLFAVVIVCLLLAGISWGRSNSSRNELLRVKNPPILERSTLPPPPPPVEKKDIPGINVNVIKDAQKDFDLKQKNINSVCSQLKYKEWKLYKEVWALMKTRDGYYESKQKDTDEINKLTSNFNNYKDSYYKLSNEYITSYDHFDQLCIKYGTTAKEFNEMVDLYSKSSSNVFPTAGRETFKLEKFYNLLDSRSFISEVKEITGKLQQIFDKLQPIADRMNSISEKIKASSIDLAKIDRLIPYVEEEIKNKQKEIDKNHDDINANKCN